MTKNMLILIKAAVFLGLTFSYGCSSEDVGGLNGGTKGKKKNIERKALIEGADVIAEEERKNKITRGIESSGAAFQVKDVDLLRSSIGTCLGAEKLRVRADMLIPVGQAGDSLPASADGRFLFLLGSNYALNDDIIEKERGNLVDFSRGNRTGISSDSLTDTYLRSLETIANVVAHYCDASVEICKCGTKDDAKVLLQRCLPGIDPNSEKIDYASLVLSEECKTGNAGTRTAIASLLSSYAFAAAR